MKPRPATTPAPQDHRPAHWNPQFISIRFEMNRKRNRHDRMVTGHRSVGPMPFKAICLCLSEITEEQVFDLRSSRT
jgi:hypothetical protein